jgi:hypothetical protein
LIVLREISDLEQVRDPTLRVNLAQECPYQLSSKLVRSPCIYLAFEAILVEEWERGSTDGFVDAE